MCAWVDLFTIAKHRLRKSDKTKFLSAKNLKPEGCFLPNTYKFEKLKKMKLFSMFLSSLNPFSLEILLFWKKFFKILTLNKGNPEKCLIGDFVFILMIIGKIRLGNSISFNLFHVTMARQLNWYAMCSIEVKLF